VWLTRVFDLLFPPPDVGPDPEELRRKRDEKWERRNKEPYLERRLRIRRMLKDAFVERGDLVD